MNRLALIALAIVSVEAPPADAHPCHGGYVIMGEAPFCPARGHDYNAPMYNFSIAATSGQIAISDEAADAARLPAGTTAVRGGGVRFLAGYHGYFGGWEMQLYRLEAQGTAALRSGTGAVTTMHAGGAEELRLLAGVRRSRGVLLYGVELAGGLRWVHSDDLPADVNPGLQGLLDARALAGVWLSPYASLSMQVSAGLVRGDEYAATVLLGVNPFPWDGLR